MDTQAQVREGARETMWRVTSLCKFATGEPNRWMFEGNEFEFTAEPTAEGGFRGDIRRLSEEGWGVKVSDFEILPNGAVRRGGYAFRQMAETDVMVQ